jgi:hypothetical protein
MIQRLLKEAGNGDVPQSLVSVDAPGVEAAPSVDSDRSQETYIGYCAHGLEGFTRTFCTAAMGGRCRFGRSAFSLP